MQDDAPAATVDRTDSLAGIFLRFLRFGLLAWGGPVAQIAMVRQELVEDARWVEPQRFNRVMAVYQALPGPEAHELCVYLGFVRRGRIGGLLAGLGFMLPGLLLMLAASVLYVRVGIGSTVAAGIFAGSAPAVAAIVLRALHRITSHVLRGRWLWAVAIVAACAQLAGVHFALVLASGAISYALQVRGRGRMAATVLLLVLVLAAALVATDARRPAGTRQAPRPHELREPTSGEVAVAGLRSGLLTFGGAYTAIPFLEQDAVRDGAWLTRSQFLDGLAISTALPAPLIIFATFVGYLGGGMDAALLITLAIFAPAFLFTIVGHRQLERAVEHPGLHAALDGVSAAVVGLMAVVTATLVAEAVPNVVAAGILLAAAALLHVWRHRLAIVFVLLAAGLAGLVLPA